MPQMQQCPGQSGPIQISFSLARQKISLRRGSSGGKENGITAGNHQSVFVVRSERAVVGAQRPLILVQPDAVRSGGDYRFNGEHHSLRQTYVIEWVGKIRHRGVFMDRVANAVSSKFANDVKATPADFPLDSTANFADRIAGAGCAERL